jgi:hypothetical protein
MNHLPRRFLKPALWVAALSATVTIAGTPCQAAEDESKMGKLNGGYFLLHDLSDNEASLPILLDLKHAPPEIQPFADEISKVAKETEAAIEKMQDRDPAIRYDKNPLPAIEKETRSAVSGDKQHRLLFGTHNDEFVRTLVVSQVEASGYAIGLCKALADDESDPARQKTLQHLAARWGTVRDDSYRLLSHY